MKRIQRMKKNSAEFLQAQAQLDYTENVLPNLDELSTCQTISSLLNSLIAECGDGDADLKVKLREARNALE